ncbi:MAG: hypothetical protein M1415_04710 [Firmicutes bacterium]|nr:hypothetical protein [Bacillota bacterium]
MIDQAPEAALGSIQHALTLRAPRRTAADERLIERLKPGYALGLNGRHPYENRDDPDNR